MFKISHPFSTISIVDFEQVNISWVPAGIYLLKVNYTMKTLEQGVKYVQS